MSDREIIIGLLKRVHRRRFSNRAIRECALILAVSLIIPLLLKLSDLILSLDAATVNMVLGLWLLVFVALLIWKLRRKTDLARAAAAVDNRALLHDEMKTAYWFLEHRRDSIWIDAQIERAAGTARRLNMNDLFPRNLPRSLYIASAMGMFTVALNFLPIPGNTNWFSNATQFGTGGIPLSDKTASGLPSQSGPSLVGSQSNNDVAGEELQSEAASTEAAKPDQLSAEDIRDLELARGDTGGFMTLGKPSDTYGSQMPARIGGLPTQLEVQLQREMLIGQRNRSSKPLDLKPSEKENSKLSYLYPPLRFGPAQTDSYSLNPDQIPLRYRRVVKEYFDAIIPPEE